MQVCRYTWDRKSTEVVTSLSRAERMGCSLHHSSSCCTCEMMTCICDLMGRGNCRKQGIYGESEGFKLTSKTEERLEEKESKKQSHWWSGQGGRLKQEHRPSGEISTKVGKTTGVRGERRI